MVCPSQWVSTKQYFKFQLWQFSFSKLFTKYLHTITGYLFQVSCPPDWYLYHTWALRNIIQCLLKAENRPGDMEPVAWYPVGLRVKEIENETIPGHIFPKVCENILDNAIVYVPCKKRHKHSTLWFLFSWKKIPCSKTTCSFLPPYKNLLSNLALQNNLPSEFCAQYKLQCTHVFMYLLIYY